MSVSQASRKGLGAAKDPLLEAASLSTDRTSHVREAFEQLGVKCTEGFRDLASSSVEIALQEIVPDAGEILDRYGDAAIVGVCQASDGGPGVLLIIGDDLLSAALEAAFGADGSEPATERQRPLSAIETRLAGAVCERVVGALRGTILAADAALELERIAAAADLPPKLRPTGSLVAAKFHLSALERGGELVVLLPQSAVQGLRPKAAPAPAARPAPRDSDWSKRIEQELQRTQVTLHAVLDECELSLGDIAELRVGQLIPLRATPRSQVKALCNDQTVFWCELGQADGAYTLRVTEFADEEQELVNAILSV